ncbi:hypothetical protein IWW38_000585 [Coemansia aciculifera]|uniref:Uncharacterized protein n=1 Tax=Coemansia aciculifera TaxID=417176 RepID=A0ACC1MAP6_9FUNG|nr:hypothetical protein IWW38_000585 [Coemansia aciculifera]
MANLMSFSLTPQEEVRVKLFMLAGKKFDPRGAPDLIMLLVILSIYVFNFAAVLFMLWNRKYPPLKSKNPILMTCIFLSSIFWLASDLQVNGHAPLKGTPFVHCKFFGVWVHLLMGVTVMSSLIGLRSYGLYYVFCRGRPYRGVPLYVSVALVALFILIFGIISQALPASMSVYYMDYVDMCYFDPKYVAGIFTYVWVNWLMVLAINWRIRHINCSFNETREVFCACSVVFLVLIGTTTITYALPEFALRARYRILLTSMNHFGAITVWWLLLYKPMYECLFNRQRYLDDWMHKLRQDGQQEAYHYDAGSLVGTTTLYGESYVKQNKQDGHRLSDSNGADINNNDDIQLVMHHHTNDSASNLMDVPQPAMLLTPLPQVPQKPVSTSKKPWGKTLGGGVDRFGASSSIVPPPSPLAMPMSQPYTPIINFTEPAATRPVRRNPTKDTTLDDPFDLNKRRLI